ncbi:glycosyl transferase possibly involved in lipopolysaccharide synthesis [Rivularia sp. PCC 7116]|uniref:heterocyst development glycosyltransferase HepC n=1 Tax=Rivularia sp. PCC 7116 TaxID=373994 RepID=UPI00029EC9C5|nr:heterocyst development glycosyltransferase HepC [Rivularia sp. PCC 7116]AFY53055.1 glycosyl transferase possibly involved in lipopolysaccharide synthesis [Rivularia sp. PCC 7116]
MVHEQRTTSVSFTSHADLEKPVQEKSYTQNKAEINNNINSCKYKLGYKIKLKGEKLLVKLTCKPSHMHLLSHRSEDFLAEWLRFSPATTVEIDSRIELEKLIVWAEQCRRCKKAIFLRLYQKGNLLRYSNNFNRLSRLAKRCFDIFMAIISVIILSPIFVALALLIKVYFHEAILQRQWCIGKQGKLFCIYNFSDNLRIIKMNSLTKLPQLFNVLKGDMSLIGRFPWSLAEVKKISFIEQTLIDTSPGITASIIGKNNYSR